MKSIVLIIGLSCLVCWVQSGVVLDRDDSSSEEDDDIDQVVGGSVAAKGEFPYQARIMIGGREGQELCGGTLIDSTTILTAAHCFENFPAGTPLNKLNIALNTVTLAGDKDAVRVSVAGYVLHENYNPKTMDNDIALISLNSPVTSVTPVDLPSDTSEKFVNSNATIIGYGHTSAGGKVSKVLLKASVNILSNGECQTAGADVNKLKLCAVAAGKDACKGDDGGPILVDGVQVGIFSSNKRCNDPKQPSVYVRLTNYLDWIAFTQATL